MKKTASSLLAVLTALLLLTGCAGREEEPEEDYAYAAHYTELSDVKGVDMPCCLAGGRLYFTGTAESEPIIIYGEAEGENGEPVMLESSYTTQVEAVYSLGLEELDLRRESYSPEPLPEGARGDTDVADLAVFGDGGLAVLEHRWFTIKNDGTVPESEGSLIPASGTDLDQGDLLYVSKQRLLFYGPDGAERGVLDTSQLLPEGVDYFGCVDLVVDGSDRLWLLSDQGLILSCGPDGGTLTRSELESTQYSPGFYLSRSGDVSLMLAQTSGTGLDVAALDPETGKPGETLWSLGSEGYLLSFGSEACDACYTDSEMLYAVSAGSEPEALLNWVNCDVNSSAVLCTCVLEGGDVLILLREYGNWSQERCWAVRLVKTPASELAEKTQLSLACLYSDYEIKELVLDFNRRSEDCRIEYRDYSQYNTDEDSSLGLMRLVTEMGAGRTPDILLTNGLPVESLAAKGLLADLWPLIESDEELGGREGVVEPFFDALSLDGRLYEVCRGFALETLAGPTTVVGPESGWGFDELYEALGRMPEGCAVFPAASGWTNFYAASELCSLSLDGFVDWENGECSFDSEEFAALLDFASLFPASIDYADMHLSESESLRSGAALLCPLYITGFSQYANYASWFGEAGMTAIGYPELPGSGAVFAPDYIGLAISASCADPEAAWSFVRQILDKEYQLGGSYGMAGFPTNRAAFDSRLESALEDSGSAGDRPAFTEEHAGALLALIEDTRLARSRLDDGLRAIIDEELSAFFAGARDAQAAAGLIQDRASTWIKEQL